MKTLLTMFSKTIRSLLLLMVILLGPQDLAAEELTRREVLKYPLYSIGASVAMVSSAGFIDSVDVADLNIPFWFSSLITIEHLPLYAQDRTLATKYSLGHAALTGAHYATNHNPTLSLVPFNAHIKVAMFSSYESYKIGRSQAKPGIYDEQFEPYGMSDLACAPFDMTNLKQPVFYIPFAVSSVFQVSSMLASEDAIWKTDEVYVDKKKVKPGVAIPLVTTANLVNNVLTAVGEEALYRGVIYEELKVSYGPKRAKLYDFFIFPAIHVPQDVARGSELGEITGLFIMRGLSTLLLDYAYDKGGLPLSVTLHSWLNMLGYTTRFLGSAGVPNQSESNNSNSVGPSMSFGFTLRF